MDLNEAQAAYLKAAGVYFDAPEYPALEKAARLKEARAALGLLDAEISAARLKKDHDDEQVG